MKKKVTFMCTAFRDGFQSVFGARVLTPDFLPAVEAARDAGISYFEAGGGARFQALYFYCNENAFDMMDSFRAAAGPDANLQTLARGVNVVGLESQSTDIIHLHAKLFKKHGMTTIRNFDALNDYNNLIESGRAITDAGLKHQICVTLMELPPGCEGAHDAAFYSKVLREILDAEIPFDSICFKDASGTAVPSKVYETIKAARKMLPEDTFIHYHTHETAGIAVLCNKAALEAGADAIDLSMKPCSGGTAQPDILTMWHALRGTDFDLDIDPEKIRQAEDVFVDCMSDYFVPLESKAVEPSIPWSPMPGGALTANTQIMRDNGIMNRYPEILAAMSEVVRRGGYGTSVTPVSQFYFQQAFANVMQGPWKKIAPSYGKMVLGYFGKTPVAPDPEIVALAKEQLGLEETFRTPQEINDEDPTKGIEPARKICQENGLEETDENLFIVATCGQKGVTFLNGEAELGVRKNAPENAAGASEYTVSVDGKAYGIAVDGDVVTVNGTAHAISIEDGISEAAIAAAAAAAAPALPSGVGAPAAAAAPSAGVEVTAKMPGSVFKLIATNGAQVAEGELLMIMEAMKMESPVSSPQGGTVEIRVSQGQQVKPGDVLAVVR